jgi:hypothetical protein
MADALFPGYQRATLTIDFVSPKNRDEASKAIEKIALAISKLAEKQGLVPVMSNAKIWDDGEEVGHG